MHPEELRRLEKNKQLMINAYNYFQSINIPENQRASFKTMHVVLTIGPDFYKSSMTLEDCWPLFQEEIPKFLQKIRRDNQKHKSSFYLPYTRKYDLGSKGSDNPDEQRPHVHFLFYSLQNHDYNYYDKMWTLGHLHYVKDIYKNPNYIVETKEHIENITDYFYDLQPCKGVRQIVHHSQGLKKLIDSHKSNN